jgi:phosphatidylglycerophosphatase A
MEPNQETIPKIKLPVYITFFGSGFLSGYSPFASGTVGSAVALLFLFIPNFSNPSIIIPISLLFFLLGVIVSDKMETVLGQDPSVVTIDEIVGMWISLWFVPITIINVGTAFLIFRILDILKPYPAGEIDKQPGGWNIMLDDVIAGIYTNFIVNIALRFL